MKSMSRLQIYAKTTVAKISRKKKAKLSFTSHI